MDESFAGGAVYGEMLSKGEANRLHANDRKEHESYMRSVDRRSGRGPAEPDPASRLFREGDGRKFDVGKPRYDLLAPEFLDGVALVLAFGAKKYADRNWEKGMEWGRCFGALMRHMWAWWGGEEKDAETGYSHLWHAGCCLMFLSAYERRRTGTDDRKDKTVAED